MVVAVAVLLRRGSPGVGGPAGCKRQLLLSVAHAPPRQPQGLRSAGGVDAVAAAPADSPSGGQLQPDRRQQPQAGAARRASTAGHWRGEDDALLPAGCPRRGAIGAALHETLDLAPPFPATPACSLAELGPGRWALAINCGDDVRLLMIRRGRDGGAPEAVSRGWADVEAALGAARQRLRVDARAPLLDFDVRVIRTVAAGPGSRAGRAGGTDDAGVAAAAAPGAGTAARARTSTSASRAAEPAGAVSSAQEAPLAAVVRLVVVARVGAAAPVSKPVPRPPPLQWHASHSRVVVPAAGRAPCGPCRAGAALPSPPSDGALQTASPGGSQSWTPPVGLAAGRLAGRRADGDQRPAVRARLAGDASPFLCIGLASPARPGSAGSTPPAAASGGSGGAARPCRASSVSPAGGASEPLRPSILTYGRRRRAGASAAGRLGASTSEWAQIASSRTASQRSATPDSKPLQRPASASAGKAHQTSVAAIEAVLELQWPGGPLTIVRARHRSVDAGRRALAAASTAVLREARLAEPPRRIAARVRELTNAPVISGMPLPALLCPGVPLALVK